LEIKPVVERAILVGAARRGDGAARVEEHLAELARLTDTAGAQVVGRLVQHVPAPTPRFFIGPGKVTQLKALADETSATLVIFDDDLSPSQGRNLERALERRIMDRSEVILDIFAHRARSKEARMQVELAQLEYLLPRLARMWVHLSRIRGGIGLRGPGETQIETDRRMIRRKITTLKRKLEDVACHRARLRAGRRAVPTVALVGYTNAGKSSLLRALTGADTLVEDRLFATLDTMTRETRIEDGAYLPPRTVRLVDTVGFIRKLPHHLVASFGATLEEARNADVVAHVVDASHPDWEEQVEVVDGVLAELSDTPPNVVHLFNKMDLVEHADMFRARVVERYPEAVVISATTGDVSEFTRCLGALR
jgi:GTP-binding protein HflX